MEAFGTSICLILRAVLLSARWARYHKQLCREQAGTTSGELAQLRAENLELRDRLALKEEQIAHLQRRLRAAKIRRPHYLAERLRILWCVEYFGIPRRQIPECFGVARSTVWRWLRRLQDGVGLCGRRCQASVKKTSEALARLVWEMASANPHWGRRHIALTLGTLGIFLAASRVRNLLLRGRPRPEGAPATAAGEPEEGKPRQIVARYPNHVWSVDRTRVWRWGLWPTWVLVAIDHFSRKVVVCCPLEGPNAGWVADAVEATLLRHGPPKHLITDQEGVFVSEAFAELLTRWAVKRRFGAVGKHGYIAVTERVIRTLKYEWLKRVPVIKGQDHLEALLAEFACYYNGWRPHSTLKGALPDLIHAGQQWSVLPRTAKVVPMWIKPRLFPETRVTGFRLAA